MTNFLNILLAIRTDLLFYILAAVCFCGFIIVFIWYLSNRRKEDSKANKNWTIESARKFLEANNVDIKQTSNNKANVNVSSAKNIKTLPKSTQKTAVKSANKVEPVKTTSTPVAPKTTTVPKTTAAPKASAKTAVKTPVNPTAAKAPVKTIKPIKKDN